MVLESERRGVNQETETWHCSRKATCIADTNESSMGIIARAEVNEDQAEYLS